MQVNIDLLKSALTELSDKSEQYRLWAGIGNDGSEMSSFVEAACCTFDDSALDHYLDNDQPIDGLQDEQIRMLRQLSSLIDRVPVNLDPVEEINHPDMEKVRRMAILILENWHRE